MKIIPSPEAVAREAVVLIAGALLAALILSKLPGLRSYIETNTRGCDCQR